MTRLHRVTGGALEADLADVRVESVIPSNPDIDSIAYEFGSEHTPERVLSPLVLVGGPRYSLNCAGEIAAGIAVPPVRTDNYIRQYS